MDSGCAVHNSPQDISPRRKGVIYFITLRLICQGGRTLIVPAYYVDLFVQVVFRKSNQYKHETTFRRFNTFNPPFFHCWLIFRVIYFYFELCRGSPQIKEEENVSWKIRTDTIVTPLFLFFPQSRKVRSQVSCRQRPCTVHPWANRKWPIGRSERALYPSYVIKLFCINYTRFAICSMLGGELSPPSSPINARQKHCPLM